MDLYLLFRENILLKMKQPYIKSTSYILGCFSYLIRVDLEYVKRCKGEKHALISKLSCSRNSLLNVFPKTLYSVLTSETTKFYSIDCRIPW